LTSESYEMKRNVKLKTFCRIGRNDANLLWHCQYQREQV
jgi:hypothetical protein